MQHFDLTRENAKPKRINVKGSVPVRPRKAMARWFDPKTGLLMSRMFEITNVANRERIDRLMTWALTNNVELRFEAITEE